MRKLAVSITVVAVGLIAAAVAIAQVTNTYSVSGSTSPTRAGTSKKPVPVSVKFGYEVGTTSGARPSPVRKYAIRFAGLRVNTNAFPKCSTATLEEKGLKGCPSGSIVGSGFIKNAAGASDNPQDRSVPCNAALSVVNAGNNRASIYVAGDPEQSDSRKRCAIQLAAPIPARFIRASGGRAVSLEFTVPSSLLHPVPTLDNAVTSVTSTIKRTTRRYRGKKVGYFESIGGCIRGRRNITVSFTPESGSTSRAQKLATCRK